MYNRVSIRFTVHSCRKTSTHANRIDFGNFSFYAKCKRSIEKQEKGAYYVHGFSVGVLRLFSLPAHLDRKKPYSRSSLPRPF